MRQYYVYILASRSKRFYVGVTNDLFTRIYEHKAGLYPKAHSSLYKKMCLVSFEMFNDPAEAIAHEKKVKKWTRARKIRLIESENRGWLDLSAGWFDDAALRSAAERSPDIRDYFRPRRRG